MILDCDYYVQRNAETNTSEAIVRMFGLTKQGTSILVHVKGFWAYFYS